MVAVILSAFYKNLITPVVVLVISTLVYSNSATNPILYGYLNREFRLPYKTLFLKVFWQVDGPRSSRKITKSRFVNLFSWRCNWSFSK